MSSCEWFCLCPILSNLEVRPSPFSFTFFTRGWISWDSRTISMTMTSTGLVVFDHRVGVCFLQPTVFKAINAFIWVILSLPYSVSFTFFAFECVAHSVTWGIGGLREWLNLSFTANFGVETLIWEKEGHRIVFWGKRFKSLILGAFQNTKGSTSESDVRSTSHVTFPINLKPLNKAILAIYFCPGTWFKFYTLATDFSRRVFPSSLSSSLN